MYEFNSEKIVEKINHFEEYLLYKDKELDLATEKVTFTNPDSWIYKEEYYKQDVRKRALQELKLDSWDESLIGQGIISEHVLKVVNLSDNNLINKFQKVKFGNIIKDKTYESDEVLYNIYKTNNVNNSFEDACELFGRKYDLISFLFYIKDANNYMQVKSSEFEKRFNELGIDYKLVGQCSWDNYFEYNKILMAIQSLMEDVLKNDVQLIDAHSFVWIIGEDGFKEWEKNQSFKSKFSTVKTYSDLDYYLINQPRIKSVEVWEKVLENEEKYDGFNFVQKVLIPMYFKPNHMIFCEDFEKEIDCGGLNLRVGEFRDRIRKILSVDELPIQLRSDNFKERAYNIPFYSDEWTNNLIENKNKFCWILRPELVEALERKYPYINQETKGLKEELVEVEEISFDKLVDNISNIEHKYQKPKSYPPKRNYEVVQKHKKIIGDCGEEKVVELEKQKLLNADLCNYVDKVHIVESDSYGYDVLSYDEQGNELHIEVKTNVENKYSFYITQYEIDTFENDSNYCLYYLYDIKGKTKIIKYSHEELKILIEEYKKPTQYIVEYKVNK